MQEQEKIRIQHEIRREIAADVKDYRQHLENIFNRLIWLGGVLLAFAFGIFTYFSGDTYDDFRNIVEGQTESRLFEYVFNDELKEGVNSRIKFFIDQVLDSDST